MPDDPITHWDIFISHASEDKKDFVQPLASALDAFGVKVWYDAFTLRLGDSLSRSIDQGLAKSDYGLVILSPAFLSKRWPEYEIRGLTAKELSGGKVILPVWHNVSRDDVLNFSPTLSDKIAIKSDGLTPLQIAVRVIEVVRPEIFERIHRRIAHYKFLSEAKVQNIATKDLHAGPIRHEKLSSDLISRIRLIRASLLGVYTHSIEFWLDGFKRDAHPSNEIAYWEHVAAVYMEYLSMASEPLSHEQYKRVLNIVLDLSMDKKRARKQAKLLPKNAFKQISELYDNELPAYDIREEVIGFGDDSEAPAEHLELLKSLDAEYLPADVPEELIRKLMRDDTNV